MNPAAAGRDLGTRYVRRDGRSVATLRLVDYGASCAVEVEAFPTSGGFPTRPGPYTFTDERRASAFVADAVEALTYLGCEVTEQ
jgi:hypothetical protein